LRQGIQGVKGKGGFYRMNKSGDQKILEAINLETGEYSATKKIDLGVETVDINNLIIEKTSLVICLGL